MNDLIAFLTARLDEKQQYAEDLLTYGLGDLSGAVSLSGQMLREVEADRKLLDLYERAKSYRDQVFARPEPRSISDEMRAVTQMMALEQVLRLRVAIYSDHPGYRQEWKP